jgi:hypothetical protein
MNDPSRFLNMTDKNCVPYTIVELCLFAGGCLMWVGAYYFIIMNARKTKLVDMAMVACCSNFAWEFLWSFIFRMDMGWFLVWTYRAWFFCDVYVFWLVLQYGSEQVNSPWIAKYFKPLCGVTLLWFGVLYYFFIKEGYDTSIGANSAYIAQLFISVLSFTLILKNPELKGLSWPVGWLRSFGTGANTVFMFLHYPHNHFVHSMAASAFVIDMAYLWIFLRFRAQHGTGKTGSVSFPLQGVG